MAQQIAVLVGAKVSVELKSKSHEFVNLQKL